MCRLPTFPAGHEPVLKLRKDNMNDPQKARSHISCVVTTRDQSCVYYDADQASTFVLTHPGQIKSIFPSSMPMFGRTAESGPATKEGTDE